MLAQALSVVEAARKLDPSPVSAVPGLWRLQCDAKHLPALLRNLAEALEDFDKTTGHDDDPLALLVRAVRFASQRGVPRDEMIAALRGGAARDEIQITDLKPQPGEIGPPDTVSDTSPVPEPRPQHSPRSGPRPEPADKFKPMPKPVIAAALRPVTNVPKLAPRPVISGETAFGKHLSEFASELSYDPDNALADAGDLVQDAGVEMDAISDRLEYAVTRMGWTPKLRALAAAWIHARNKISANNTSSTPGFKLDLADAMIMSRVASELAQIETSPDFEPEPEEAPGWTPPVPGRRP